jgi:hypothetical protein
MNLKHKFIIFHYLLWGPQVVDSVACSLIFFIEIFFSLDWIHSTPINVFLRRESVRKQLIDLSCTMRGPLSLLLQEPESKNRYSVGTHFYVLLSS